MVPARVAYSHSNSVPLFVRSVDSKVLVASSMARYWILMKVVLLRNEIRQSWSFRSVTTAWFSKMTRTIETTWKVSCCQSIAVR